MLLPKVQQFSQCKLSWFTSRELVAEFVTFAVDQSGCALERFAHGAPFLRIIRLSPSSPPPPSGASTAEEGMVWNDASPGVACGG